MSLFIAKSVIHGFGLYSDKPLAREEDITVVFKRINTTQVFKNDFHETPYGRVTNHSDNPNTILIVRPEDILLRAIKEISIKEEITSNYHELIALFNNDPTLIKMIKFW